MNCAKKALQPKLDSAPAGSTILVKGTCVGTAVIQKNLTLKGNPTATIDGNNANSAVYIVGQPKVRLVHLKITRGAGLQGAGVTSFGSVTLDHCTVTGNHAQITGGGILAANKVTLIDSSVVHNTLEWDATNAVVTGAGISAGSVRLVRSTVRFNTAHAISAASTATASGGGIAVSNGVVAIRSHIDRNTARADGQTATARGGGIAEQLPGAVIRLTDSTVSKNTATGSSTLMAGTARGGGVYASKVVAKRTDFVGNRLVAVSPTQGATATGGGLYVLQTGLAHRRSHPKLRDQRRRGPERTGAWWRDLRRVRNGADHRHRLDHVRERGDGALVRAASRTRAGERWTWKGPSRWHARP